MEQSLGARVNVKAAFRELSRHQQSDLDRVMGALEDDKWVRAVDAERRDFFEVIIPSHRMAMEEGEGGSS